MSKKLGMKTATEVDWTNPRLVCVAGSFDRYDEYAVQQINRTIELVRYRDFGGELLALELLTATASPSAPTPPKQPPPTVPPKSASGADKTVADYLAQSPSNLKNLYADLDAVLVSMGDDVQKTERKFYYAYKRFKNFACVEVHPQTKNLLLYLKVDPSTVDLVEGYSRDVSKIGHFGTGDLELRLKNADDLTHAEPLIKASYEAS